MHSEDVQHMLDSWANVSRYVGVEDTQQERDAIRREIESGRARVEFDSSEWAEPVPNEVRYWLVRVSDGRRMLGVTDDEVTYEA